ncbi:MAG: hypothetical protein CMK00_05040 [Planctomycetes bacterium]|jgi:beta-phosphoglucomutase-like phosphatase (HAD superfamily)|nr:hypothetical protein [Planctomycetota bacterium]HJO26870.1 hypothetical protein [Planctomycetota bacterium]
MGHSRLHETFGAIAAIRDAGQLPLVVFDLDSTLFSTAPRNLRILEEFVARHGDDEPRLREVLASVCLDDMGWNIHDTLMERGLKDPSLLKALRAFWFARFFTDEYVLTDTPTPGAVEFVNHCHDAGALIYYLSGRHVGGMEQGTVRSLTEHGFPFWRGRCVVHLKPTFEMADRAFKDDALADIRSYRSPVAATFENEPGNANLFLEAFPDALHYFLETVHSPEAEVPHADLIRGEDFCLPART